MCESKTGGLTVADEVQTGFGRLGTHFWGFEAQGAEPDIVTMAKGIANGFPMGAVVTRPEIADALVERGARYFNTYGGNPLACAVANAVLEVEFRSRTDGRNFRIEQIGKFTHSG